MSHKAHYR